MKPVVFACLLVICGYAADRKPVRLTYITLGGGTYGVLADREGPSGLRRNSYFNTLKLTGYLRVFGVTAAVGVPAQLTLELFDEKSLSRYSAYISDLSVTISKRFGFISPRILFKAPLGYPTKNSVAWIGSGNMRAGVGADFRLGSLIKGKISFSATAELLSTINDTAGYPRMGVGSLSGYAAVKSSYSLRSNLRTALQLYTDYGTIRYSDWSAQPQQSITIAPILSVWYNPVKSVAVSVWYGYGPKYSSLYGGTAGKVIIAGLSAGYGL